VGASEASVGPLKDPPPAPPACGRGDLAAIARQLAGQTALLLGWRPDDFWNATPAELAAILSAFTPEAEAADNATLTQLMELFPDAPTGGD
jgi:Phage tail assembly chaperone protein, TAC